MPDHLHIITNGARKPSDTPRFIKGIAGHRIIQYLKDRAFDSSLEKIRAARKSRRHEYHLWEQESNVMLLTAEPAFMQRVHYVHHNPVRAGLAERAADYAWSSARQWKGCATADEPLRVDLNQTVWRTPR